MNRRLPPLYALRAFEATARLMSAKQAAEELHVTPAAISHQLKILENHHGIKLFIRRNRQLLLTEIGQQYAITLQEIFDRLASETCKFTQTANNTLTVTVEPAFAIYWLIPRLEKFKKQFKNIELKISATYYVIDFKKSDTDVGIRWGSGKHPGLVSMLLFRNEVYPVCSPALLKKHPIRKPNDLKYHTLLHETAAIAQANYPDWRTWIKGVKANEVNVESGLYFETGYLLIQAAIEGQGVALERDILVKSAIKAGTLVRLFNHSIHESVNGYFVVYPEHCKTNSKIFAFTEWLHDEINS